MHDGRILERSTADLCEAAQEVKFEAILNSADDDGNADGRRIASRRLEERLLLLLQMAPCEFRCTQVTEQDKGR